MNKATKFALIAIPFFLALALLRDSESRNVARLSLSDGSELVLTSAHSELCFDTHDAYTITKDDRSGQRGCWERSDGNLVLRWSVTGGLSRSDELGDADVFSQEQPWVLMDQSFFLTGSDLTHRSEWDVIFDWLKPISLLLLGAWLGWFASKPKQGSN